MTKRKRIAIFTLTAVLIALIIGQMVVSMLSVKAQAAEGTKFLDLTTSNVRDDLSSMGLDSLSFLSETENNFIGMSQYYDSNNNLRTYVYMNYIGDPSDSLTISISTSVSDPEGKITEKFTPYELVFCNDFYTLRKYEVVGLSNNKTVTRRFKLQNISLEEPLLELDKLFVFHGITNNTIEVFRQEVETITITDKEVHFYCYGDQNDWADFWGGSGKLGWGETYTDAFYIFFNTDKPIDNLLEIEVTFKPYIYYVERLGYVDKTTSFTMDYLNKIANDTTDPCFDSVLVKEEDQQRFVVAPGTTRVQASETWFGSTTYKYEDLDNIMDLREYDIKDGMPFVFKKQKEKYTWGVNFFNATRASTEGSRSLMGSYMASTAIYGYGVSDTAILRLKYETNGIIKNAYAIDTPTDDFTGNDAYVDIPDPWDKAWEFFQMILEILSIILLIVIIAPFIGPLINIVFSILKFLFNCLVFIITFPYKLVERYSKQNKGK